MESIILIGGGGHCVSCIDVLQSSGKYNIIGILDTPDKVGSSILGVKIIGTDNDIQELASKYKNFLISLGQIKSSASRERIYVLVKKYGGILPVIISPKAHVSAHASIKEGTIVMHYAMVNANAKIGKSCIINSGAIIEHESIIGDFCHISTRAIVNGQVNIGNNSFIGSNSVIVNNVSLTENIIVGAGSCIYKTIKESGTYIGNSLKINNCK
jgi:sugar O-acyltransferase (sialic acid O-acetyltransferase NeuD family)